MPSNKISIAGIGSLPKSGFPNRLPGFNWEPLGGGMSEDNAAADPRAGAGNLLDEWQSGPYPLGRVHEACGVPSITLCHKALNRRAKFRDRSAKIK